MPATGGNFSARIDASRLLITASGVHKGELAPTDFLALQLDGSRADASTRKTSYETGLHLQLYRWSADVGAVLHVHSVANTLLSQRGSSIRLANFELLKILPGAPDPASTVEVPVFGNDQDIDRLATVIDRHLKASPRTPAYLIAGHGLYAWGATVDEARYRVEALEFMFECVLRTVQE